MITCLCMIVVEDATNQNVNLEEYHFYGSNGKIRFPAKASLKKNKIKKGIRKNRQFNRT